MHGLLSDADMDELLAFEIFGHLGCCDSGKPYVVPMAFVYHEDALYGQTAEGKKVDMLRRNPMVCFQVEQKKDRSWRSVMCWGTFEELDFSQLRHPDAIAAVRLLTERIGKIQQSVGVSIPFDFSSLAVATTVDGRSSTIFRIVVRERTGKYYVAE